LNWSGIEIDPDTLTPEVYTPSKKGSLQPAMIGSARRHARIAYPIYGADALMAEIAAGHPVVVLQNLGVSWYPVWHYAVVIGYDLSRNEISMHTGTRYRQSTSLSVFEKTWARSDYWGLLVLHPTRIPATAKEQNYVAAVLGLEKARQWKAAALGYQTAINRWPDHLASRIGLANSFYALGNLPSAEAALVEASARFPREGIVFNNLAQVLYEQGKVEEALAAARRAVELGGAFKDEFQRTLEEIRAGKKKR
jgi:tetratricopeptide (TPR) repeat protein